MHKILRFDTFSIKFKLPKKINQWVLYGASTKKTNKNSHKFPETVKLYFQNVSQVSPRLIIASFINQCVQNSPIGTHGLYRVVADIPWDTIGYKNHRKQVF